MNVVSYFVNDTIVPSPTITLSKIVNIKLVFDEPVIAAAPGAFEIAGLTNGDGIVVTFAGTTVTLTFSTAGDFDSLPDGNHTLKVNRSLLNPIIIPNIRRLFGDANGDGTVDVVDFNTFGTTMGKSVGDPGFLPLLDFNSDTIIDLTDYGEFGNRFGVTLP